MTIECLDISKYQGVLTEQIVTNLVAKGIKAVMVRFSQGAEYKDPQAANNVRLLQAGKILVGPYHFCTTDNATLQYQNFTAAMKDFQFDLIPWMDCEAYAGINGQVYSEREIRYLPKSAQFVAYARGAVLGYQYPTSAIVDSLGRQLYNGWMKTQPKLLALSVYPGIYTNAGSGNVIFGSNTAFAKYPLGVASWTSNPTPYLPKAWKTFYMWQNAVIDAAPYGFDCLKVDHDFWGPQFPFPNDTPPEPVDEYAFTLHITKPYDKTISGVLK